MKDHEVREFVDELTKTAREHEGCQSLRASLSRVVKRHLVNISIASSPKTIRTKEVMDEMQYAVDRRIQ